MKLHYQYQIFPNLIIYATLSDSRRGYVPKVIETYYDKVMSDLRNYFLLLCFIKQTYHIDAWQLAVDQMLSEGLWLDFGFDEL